MSDDRPFSLADLERRLDNPGAQQLARRLGVRDRTIHRWRIEGLTFDQADRLAVRVGFHPANVWGALWWRVDLDDQEVAA